MFWKRGSLTFSQLQSVDFLWNPQNGQAHKMVNHTQTFHRQFADELFSVFEHFVNLALEGLNMKLLAK